MTQIQVNSILPNPQQPRTWVNQVELRELADSMRQSGLLQPIVVEDAGAGNYILIAGQRRLAAAKLLDWREIEAQILPGMNGSGNTGRLVLALTENVQRQDMSPTDEARAYQRLREAGMSNAAIAHKLGVSSLRVAERIKLLQLEPEIGDMIDAGVLPVDRRAVDALLSVPAGDMRVALAQRLSQPGAATIKAVQDAAKRLNEAIAAQPVDDRVPALRISRAADVNRQAWDVLAQANVVPPWSVVERAALKVCGDCPLRPNASQVVCRECPGAQILAEMVKAAK